MAAIPPAIRRGLSILLLFITIFLTIDPSVEYN